MSIGQFSLSGQRLDWARCQRLAPPTWVVEYAPEPSPLQSDRKSNNGREGLGIGCETHHTQRIITEQDVDL